MLKMYLRMENAHTIHLLQNTRVICKTSIMYSFVDIKVGDVHFYNIILSFLKKGKKENNICFYYYFYKQI